MEIEKTKQISRSSLSKYLLFVLQRLILDTLNELVEAGHLVLVSLLLTILLHMNIKLKRKIDNVALFGSSKKRKEKKRTRQELRN